MQRTRALLVVYGRLAREERERQGLTQAVVAERTGLRVRNLRDIEHGRANSNISAYAHLAQLGLGRPFSAIVKTAEAEIAAARSRVRGRCP